MVFVPKNLCKVLISRRSKNRPQWESCGLFSCEAVFKGGSQTTVRYRVRVNREENHTPNFHQSERWGGKWSKSARDKPMSANSRSDRDARMFLVWRFAFQLETDFTMPSKTLTKLSVVIAPNGAGRVFGANAMVMFLKCWARACGVSGAVATLC